LFAMNRGAPSLIAGFAALALAEFSPAFSAHTGFEVRHRTGCVYRNWLWYTTLGSSAALAMDRSRAAFFCAATAVANAGSLARARRIASSSVIAGELAAGAGLAGCAGTGAEGIPTCCPGATQVTAARNIAPAERPAARRTLFSTRVRCISPNLAGFNKRVRRHHSIVLCHSGLNDTLAGYPRTFGEGRIGREG